MRQQQQRVSFFRVTCSCSLRSKWSLVHRQIRQKTEGTASRSTSFRLHGFKMNKCASSNTANLFFKQVNHCQVHLSSSPLRISPQASEQSTCLFFPGASRTGSFYLFQIGRNRWLEMNYGPADQHYFQKCIHGKTSCSLVTKRQVFSS